MKLTRHQKTLVASALDKLFGNLEAGLLGKWFRGSAIYFTITQETDPLDTLEGAYVHTLSHLIGPNPPIDDNEMKSLADITSNYIQSEKLKRINHMMADIKAAKTNDELKEAIQANIDKSTNYVSMLLNTETRNVQAYAERDGIAHLSASIGDSDPTVVKLGIKDDKTCEVCLKLWFSADGTLRPRPWKLSELREGYNKDRKNPVATLNASHPHCRCTLSYVPKNYGFSAQGVVQFKEFGYDYYNEYHAIHKHDLMDESLIKSCTCSHFHEVE